MLEISVCEKEWRHITVPKIVTSKCNRGRGLFGAEQLRCWLVKLAVTLLLCAEQLRCWLVKLAVTLLLCAEQLHCWLVKLAVTLLLCAEQLHCWLVKLAVTLLQLSHCAACNNTQHCLKLPTYLCTVSTELIDIPDHQVIIIAVTDGYTSLLSVPVWISLSLLCSEDDEDWRRTEELEFSSPLFVTSLTWS